MGSEVRLERGPNGELHTYIDGHRIRNVLAVTPHLTQKDMPQTVTLTVHVSAFHAVPAPIEGEGEGQSLDPSDP